jgi:hypothetical protein
MNACVTRPDLGMHACMNNHGSSDLLKIFFCSKEKDAFIFASFNQLRESFR